jgi:hypothetical protein
MKNKSNKRMKINTIINLFKLIKRKIFLKFSKESLKLMNCFRFIQSDTLKFKYFDASTIKISKSWRQEFKENLTN